MLPTVYTSPTCQPCRMLKKWLTDNNIPFEEKDAREHIDFIQELTGQRSVPVLTYRDKFVVGYTPLTKPLIEEMFPV